MEPHTLKHALSKKSSITTAAATTRVQMKPIFVWILAVFMAIHMGMVTMTGRSHMTVMIGTVQEAAAIMEVVARKDARVGVYLVPLVI